MARSPKNNKREQPARTVPTRQRLSSNQRGYNYQWQQARISWLQANPVCAECKWIDVPRNMVIDHIQPHRGGRLLFWDRTNWQTLCRNCHDQKTGRGE
jgi:5-methylcytosine-specific restriction protein A